MTDIEKESPGTKAIEGQIRQVYAQVVWSHKIHEKEAEIHLFIKNTLEIARIFSAAITSSGILALFFTDALWVKITTAAVSLISIFVTSYFKVFDHQQLYSSNKSSALKYLNVRHRLTSIITDLYFENITIENLKTVRDDFISEISDIAMCSPNTSNLAVSRARKALIQTQDNKFSNDEINSYLPVFSRREDQ